MKRLGAHGAALAADAARRGPRRALLLLLTFCAPLIAAYTDDTIRARVEHTSKDWKSEALVTRAPKLTPTHPAPAPTALPQGYSTLAPTPNPEFDEGPDGFRAGDNVFSHVKFAVERYPMQAQPLPAFAARALVRRADDRFRRVCACSNVKYVSYMVHAYDNLRHARNRTLVPQKVLPSRGLVLDHSAGRFHNGVGNNVPRWVAALRLGPALRAAVFARYSAGCGPSSAQPTDGGKCVLDPTEYFTGYFNDWRWSDAHQEALDALPAGRVARVAVDCGEAWGVECRLRPASAADAAPQLLAALTGLDMAALEELDAPAVAAAAASGRLADKWILAPLQRLLAAFPWVYVRLPERPDVLAVAGGLTEDPLAAGCARLPLGCEGLRSLYPTPALQQAALPALRRMDAWKGVAAVHMRSGWVDHLAAWSRSSALSRAAPAAPASAQNCSSSQLLAALDASMAPCEAGPEEGAPAQAAPAPRDRMCIQWRRRQRAGGPSAADVERYCPYSGPEAAEALALTAAAAASVPPAPSAGVVGRFLQCAYRVAAAAAGGPEWGVLAIGDTPALIKAAAAEPSLRGRVATTLDAITLGGTSFNGKVCDLERATCTVADQQRIQSIQAAAVVDVLVAGLADAALSLPGSSFIRAGAAAWGLRQPPLAEAWADEFAGEVILDQNRERGGGVGMPKAEVERILSAPHCPIPSSD